MNQTPTGKRGRRLYLVLGLVALAWITFFDTHSLFALMDLNRRESQILHEIERLDAEKQRLELEIDRLRNDPDLIERIAREEYGMKRPDETIYILNERPR